MTYRTNEDTAKQVHLLLATRPIDYMQIGKILSDAKHHSEHGTWIPFLDKYEISQRLSQIHIQLFERFRNSQFAEMNLPMTLMKELSGFSNEEIETNGLYNYTVQAIKTYKKTGVLPEQRQHKQPVRIQHNRQKPIDATDARQPELIYEASTASSNQTDDYDRHIEQLENRIDELEKRVDGLEAKIELLIQLIRK